LELAIARCWYLRFDASVAQVLRVRVPVVSAVGQQHGRIHVTQGLQIIIGGDITRFASAQGRALLLRLKVLLRDVHPAVWRRVI
jgi:hypothetical protein